MSLVAVDRPASRVLTLTEVKAHLRVDVDDDDTLIEGLILAVEQSLDGRDGWLGRALVSQRWDLKRDGFGGPSIRIPLPPLIAVDEITYLDAAGVSQTLDTSVYQVVGAGGWGPGEVVLREGQSWPDTALARETVTVRFRAGYVDTETSPATGEVPAAIKQAMKLAIGSRYEHREDIVVGAMPARLPETAESLLAQYQVHFFP